MSTLADELLQDFEDSGSEGDDQQKDALFGDDGGDADGENGLSKMELDGDEEDDVNDEEMAGMNDVAQDIEDEEETKAKVEKMELAGVDDVRSVAVLMKKLDPILEVSISPFSLFRLSSLKDLRFTSTLLY